MSDRYYDDSCQATITIPGQKAAAGTGDTAQCIWHEWERHPQQHRAEFDRFDAEWDDTP